MHAGVKMTVYALEVPLAVFFPCYQKRYCLKAELYVQLGIVMIAKSVYIR